MNALQWLQEWYKQNCDGFWEHCYEAVRIGTLDNPGWFIDINLVETNVETRVFDKIVIERSENDWIHCRVVNGVFQGRGGPLNLEEIIVIFQKWSSV